MTTMQGVTTDDRPRRRVDAVDLLRGLVMVLMILDHTRDFTHSAQFDPTDLAHTTVPLFITRWVTHLCAPTFVFLAGTGAYLQLLRGKSRGALSQFLITRGLWLIVLEFTIVSFGVAFHVDTTFLGLAQVIWVIGISMIVLAGLLWLPTGVIAAFGALLIVGHNAFDQVQVTPWAPGAPMPSAGAWLWTVLHQPGFLPLSPSGAPMVFVLYPLIPWVGVMAIGYAFGAFYRLPSPERTPRITMLGIGLLVTFVVVRGLNVYGDPAPWTHQSSATFTVLSFFKVQKYPPSLSYVCATLGISLLLLAWFERRLAREDSTWLDRTLIMFGRVPLFFYMLQWFVAHGIGVLALMATGQPYSHLFQNPILATKPPAGTGFSLPMVYGFWLLGVALLYFPCRWYAGVKARRRDWWLSYL